MTANDLSFNSLWLEYDKFKKLKLKEQSYRKIKNLAINHIVPFFKDMKVVDIDAKAVVNWMSEIEEQGYSNSYKKSLHSELVTILNYAVKFYGLKDNVASKVGGFNTRKVNEQKKINFYTLEEFKKFINVIEDPIYKLLFKTLYFTGLRIGECLALNWNDFDSKYLHITKSLSKEKFGDEEYHFNTPKTKSSVRDIYLDENLIHELNELKKSQQLKEGFENNWFIFGEQKPLSQTTVSRRRDEYSKLANIKKIRLHDFRHSHATLLVSLGTPIPIVSQRLGHSDYAMTFNTYVHFYPKNESELIDKLNSINC